MFVTWRLEIKNTMLKTYFTLGQSHTNTIYTFDGPIIWDKNGIVEVVSETAMDALDFIRLCFGDKWGLQYGEDEIGGTFMQDFPKGIIHSFTITPDGTMQ